MPHISRSLFRPYGLLVGLITVALLAGCATSPTEPSSTGPTSSAPAVTSGPPTAGPPTAGPPTAGPATTQPPGGGGQPAKLVQVVMTKKGGLSGLNQRLLISADGSWIFLDAKTGANSPGRFTADQVSTIASMLADPALLAESKMPSNPAQCADAVVYAVETLAVQFSYDQCSAAGKRPATARLIRAIEDATPL